MHYLKTSKDGFQKPSTKKQDDFTKNHEKNVEPLSNIILFIC